MDVGHHLIITSQQTTAEEDATPSGAPGARSIAFNASDRSRPAFRWRPEELFASQTARDDFAGLAVVSVILGTVGFVAVSRNFD